MALTLIGLCLATGAAIVDVYLHRGIETGEASPYVVQPTGRELATNVDLTVFPTSQLDSVVSALQTNGFRYARQSFAWSQIEPTQGSFQWDTYDAIVDALVAHGIQPIAVLHRSPDWARAPDMSGWPDAPPVASAAFGRFVEEFVRRYRGRVEFVQLWDLPNNAERWGGIPASAPEYLSLLAEGFNAARTADPETKVVLAELESARTDGTLGADLSFLESIYNMAGSAFFDIVAVRIDGGTRSPYDRVVGGDQQNLSRAILFRRLMVREDDVAKPIWATHYGWNVGLNGISAADQGAFLVSGLERARAEWPWMGLMFAWDLMPKDGSEGYALFTADGTATAAFTALGQFAGEGKTDVAPTGFVPMGSRPVAYLGAWQDQHLSRRTFRTTSEVGATATLRFRGTGVTAILRYSPQAGPVEATIDGNPLPGWPSNGEAAEIDLEWFQAEDSPVVLVSGLDDEVHELRLRLAGPGQLTVGGMVVTREVPFMWPVVVLAGAGGLALFLALRELAYVVAIRSGYLQRDRGRGFRPALPQLPDWRPMRRV